MKSISYFLFLCIILTGCWNVADKELQPKEPSADFSFAGGGCTGPCNVTFTNKSTGNSNSYVWDFGDNTPISTEANPMHRYQQDGTYTVKLTITGSAGPGSTKTQQVTINEPIPSKDWDKSYGGEGDDGITTIINTSDGGLLLGGYSSSTMVSEQRSVAYGARDFWVVKLNASGDKVWENRFGGALNDEITSIVATTDGYILAGKSNSKPPNPGSRLGAKTALYYGTATGTTVDETRDFWVVKINSSGGYVWDKSFGGALNDEITSVIPTNDGGFMLGGKSDSPTGGLGSKKAASYGNADFWVVKINANGGYVSDYSFGGNSEDGIKSMTATSDGGFVLGGYSNSDNTGIRNTTYGAKDFWVVKIDANGGKVWDKSFGGSADDEMYSIVPTSDGGFVLGGESKSLPGGSGPGAKKADFYGNADYWVVKIDGKGEYVWDKSFGGDQDDVIKSVVRAQAPDGGFVLGGFTASPPNPTKNKSAATYGSRDFWVVKINASGDRVWDTSFGGSGIDEITSVVATTTPDKSFILGGFSASPVGGLPGRTLPLGTGGSDFWLVKIK